MPTRFTQSCPTCGRRVEVRTNLLGATVACQHCRAEFVATGEEESIQRIDASEKLMARVENALRQTDGEPTV